MKIKLNWPYVSGEIDTKDLELIDLPARESKYEKDASICIRDGMNFQISLVHLGDRESSNALAKEIVRRFNEFPEDLKR